MSARFKQPCLLVEQSLIVFYLWIFQIVQKLKWYVKGAFYVKVKFSTADQNVGKSLKCFLNKFELLHLAIFKILQFKVNIFPLTSVLPVL